MTTASSTTGPSFADLKRQACSEFLAGDEAITIVPSFSHPKPLELISMSTIGPFTAGVQVQVPMWLATLLKQKSLCRMQAPPWMEVDTLRKILKFEHDKDSFSPDLPFRYQEISKSLLAVADLEDQEAIRILCEDIATVRMDKIRRNLHTLSEQSLGTLEPLPVIDVTGIGSLELAAIEPFCATAFQHHLLLSSSTKRDKMETSGDAEGEEQTGNVDDNQGNKTKATSRLRRFR